MPDDQNGTTIHFVVLHLVKTCYEVKNNEMNRVALLVKLNLSWILHLNPGEGGFSKSL